MDFWSFDVVVSSVYAEVSCAWVPTLIIEVVTGTTQEELHNIYKSAKDYVDEELASVFIVISDANSALLLPDDTARQNFIWVDDFSVEEARKYLSARGITETIQQDAIMSTCGTRPISLKRAADDLSLNQWSAEVDIANAL